VSETTASKTKLRVKPFQFMQELQRGPWIDDGASDARFSGPTYIMIGEAADYDPQETAISARRWCRSMVLRFEE